MTNDILSNPKYLRVLIQIRQLYSTFLLKQDNDKKYLHSHNRHMHTHLL